MREHKAHPVIDLTATFIAFRNGFVKLRNGKNIKLKKGEPLD